MASSASPASRTSKSVRLEGRSGIHPDQKFILDDKHDRSLASAGLHQKSTSVAWQGQNALKMSGSRHYRKTSNTCLGDFVPDQEKILVERTQQFLVPPLDALVTIA